MTQIASCGHTLQFDDPGFAVEYHSQDCDAVDGWQKCVVYATYCRCCAMRLVGERHFISARNIESLGSDSAD